MVFRLCLVSCLMQNPTSCCSSRGNWLSGDSRLVWNRYGFRTLLGRVVMLSAVGSSTEPLLFHSAPILTNFTPNQGSCWSYFFHCDLDLHTCPIRCHQLSHGCRWLVSCISHLYSPVTLKWHAQFHWASLIFPMLKSISSLPPPPSQDTDSFTTRVKCLFI